MYKFCINVLLNLFIICVTGGASNFLIFQNINGSEWKVISNRIETTNGANFTLICKISSNNDEKLLDSDVVWRKKREKIKFSNVNDENDSAIPDANILKFASVTAKDQGNYVCKTLKYAHFRIIQLFMRNEASDNIVKGLKSHKKYKRETELEKALNERDKYIQRWKEDLDNQSQASNNNVYYLYIIRENKYNTKADTLLKIFYILLAVVAIFVLIYGIAKCCQDDNQPNTENTTNSQRIGNRYRLNLPNTRNVNQQNTSSFEVHDITENTNLCSHRACHRYRLEHPLATCLLGVDNAAALDLNGFHSGRGTIIQENNLDLPPSYADSVANSATGSILNLHIADDGLSNRILDANDTTNSVLPPAYEDADDSFSTRIINANDGFNSAQPPTYEDALINIVISEPTNNDSSIEGGNSGGSEDSCGNTGEGVGEGGVSEGGGDNSNGNTSGRAGDSERGGDIEWRRRRSQWSRRRK